MEVDIISLGKRLRHIRKKKGYTLESFGEKSGFSFVFLSQIERGQRTGSVDTLVSIANALEVSIEDLLVDSLIVTNSKIYDDLTYLLLDCEEREYRFIVKNAENVKLLLKKYCGRTS